MAITNDKFNESESSFEEPTEAEKELTSWVTQHITRWRDHRDANYMDLWLEYERVFRGIWAAEDKQRDSERSRIISPATQQAVETRHAEIVEAIFGNGEYFDIQDDVKDADKIDVKALKALMTEDLDKEKIRKYVSQVELLAEIYGTGIAELVVSKKPELIATTMPMPDGTAAYGVTEKE